MIELTLLENGMSIFLVLRSLEGFMAVSQDDPTCGTFVWTQSGTQWTVVESTDFIWQVINRAQF